MPYLQGVLGADGQHLVLEVAEFAAPGAPFADPADEAGLVGAAHRAVAPARAQQLALREHGKSGKKTSARVGTSPRPRHLTTSDAASVQRAALSPVGGRV